MMSGPELSRRIAFTLGALLVYRFGTYLPLPGVNLSVWSELFRSQAGGILGIIDVTSGGAVARLAALALGITPFITAAILVQLITILPRRLRAWRRQGEHNRARLDRYTLYIAILFAAFQSFGLAGALEGVNGLVLEPGWVFRLTTVATLTGGTVFLIWLCGQITTRGIGNGIALILFVGVVTELPVAVVGMLDLGQRGALSHALILALLVMLIVVTAFVVFMERGRRRLLVRYPSRRVGVIDRQSHLSLKLNSAGVMPLVFVPSLMLLPASIANFDAGAAPGWIQTVAAQLGQGQPLFFVVYAVLIIIGVVLYTAFILDPDDAAADLRKHGGRIEGVEPGEPTAAYLDRVVSRTTVIGAAYLAFICLIPEILIAYAKVPFYFGGVSLLIVVCTVMDIEAQVMAKRS